MLQHLALDASKPAQPCLALHPFCTFNKVSLLRPRRETTSQDHQAPSSGRISLRNFAVSTVTTSTGLPSMDSLEKEHHQDAANGQAGTSNTSWSSRRNPMASLLSRRGFPAKFCATSTTTSSMSGYCTAVEWQQRNGRHLALQSSADLPARSSLAFKMNSKDLPTIVPSH